MSEENTNSGHMDEDRAPREYTPQTHSSRHRIRKKRRHKFSFREKVIYYTIIGVGLLIAVFLTWKILELISSPNIPSGIIR